MKKPIIYLSIVFCLVQFVSGQDLERQVIVTKEFEPIIKDAQKLTVEPTMVDTVTIRPDFKYSIYPIPAKSTFQIDPIKAAKLVGVPISELYKYEIVGGIGNHHVPLLELYANNLRSEDLFAGAQLKLNNVEGKVKLDNDQKISAANSSFELVGFGKKFYDNINLEGKLGYKSRGLYFYGLATDTIYEQLPDKKDLKQRYGTLFIETQLYSNQNDADFVFQANGAESFTWDKYDFFENVFDLNFEFDKELTSFDLHSSFSNTLYTNNLINDTVSNYNQFVLSPYISNFDGELRYKLGLSLTFWSEGGETDVYFHPNAGLEYTIVNSILTTFFSLDGHIESNNYEKVLNMNPFMAPGSKVSPTNHKFSAQAGIKGFFTKNLSYHVSGELSSIDAYPVFSIDTLSMYKNYYTSSPTDVDMTRIGGGIKFDLKEKALVSIEGNLFRYKPQTPWHLPEWDTKLFVRYNFKEKISMSGGLNLIGPRLAQHNNMQTIEMKTFGVFDFQLNYYFSKALRAFLMIKNLNASKYDLWYQYPYYKSMVVVGGAYKF